MFHCLQPNMDKGAATSLLMTSFQNVGYLKLTQREMTRTGRVVIMTFILCLAVAGGGEIIINETRCQY